MFLRQKDYYSLIEQPDLEVIIEDQFGLPMDVWLTEMMLAGVEEVGSYLSHVYDTALIFKSVTTYIHLAAKTYNIGDVVLYPDVDTGSWYVCLTDNNIGENPSSSANWVANELADPRSASMKKTVINWVLYDIHTRLNPRNIPEIRMQKKDEAERWLNRISKGQVNLDLPKIDPDEDQANRIMWGGESKNQNSF